MCTRTHFKTQSVSVCLGSNLGSTPPPFLPKFPITQCPLSPPIPPENPIPSTPQTPQSINPSLLSSILSNYVDLVTIVSSTSFHIWKAKVPMSIFLWFLGGFSNLKAYSKNMSTIQQWILKNIFLGKQKMTINHNEF